MRWIYCCILKCWYLSNQQKLAKLNLSAISRNVRNSFSQFFILPRNSTTTIFLRGPLKIPLSHRFFAQITPRNCLKCIFTPSLPNHAGWQIDLSRNNAIFSIQFTFLRFEICPLTQSCFALGAPLSDHKIFCDFSIISLKPDSIILSKSNRKLKT